MKLIAVVLLALLMAGCSGGMKEAAVVIATTPAVVQAPVNPPVTTRTDCAFSTESAIVETPAGSGHWYVGAEVGIPAAGHYHCELPFALPTGKTLAKFSGSYAARFDCGEGQFLAMFIVDGSQWTPRNWPGNPKNADSIALEVHNDIPLKYSTGNGKLVVELDSECAWSPAGSQKFEIQGDMQVI